MMDPRLIHDAAEGDPGEQDEPTLALWDTWNGGTQKARVVMTVNMPLST